MIGKLLCLVGLHSWEELPPYQALPNWRRWRCRRCPTMSVRATF